MDWLDNFGGLAGIGILLAGIGFAYAQFRAGASKAKDDLIQTLRDTAIAEKQKAERLAAEKVTIIDSHQVQINELNKEIGILRGTLDATNLKVKEYTTLLQGRNPEQIEFMKVVLESVKASNSYMKDTTVILGEIKTFMEELNNKGMKTESFINKIEKATAEESGKPLRT